MKRIETLTPKERLAFIHTLNVAALCGGATWQCPATLNVCHECPIESECDATYTTIPGTMKTFCNWLAWLCDDVKGERISSGYRVLLTDRINHYRISRPDGVDIYAVGQPLPLLLRDREGNPALAITDVFASRYGAVCILVEDTYSSEKWLYSDIL